MDEHVANVRAMLDDDRPLFGICLGHQLLARALGLETFKLRFGHRGANHPVLEQATGRVLVTQPEPRLRGRRAGRARTPTSSSRTSRSTTARSRACGSPTATSGRCSSTPRPHPGRTTRATRWCGSSRSPPRTRRRPADAPARRPEEDLRDRLRPDRDRPGLRVRLLRRAGPAGAAPGGLRDGPDQLQPGDDHDRPGLGRPHVHRAARPGGHRHRAAARAARCAAAHAGRPDGAQRGHGAAGRGRAGRARHRADRRLHPRHRDGRGPRAVRAAPWRGCGLRCARSHDHPLGRRGRGAPSRRARCRCRS